ncbi:ASKHA domain-containing protein [Schnuerera sp. xch1]|uniref:ASKHA domain-containing protein n=1 Tax=Schnuerera sp. xch1 TaxID=2874283 RepID=UPI001CC19E8D|nr:ASKHA domain-containing protein [Schnuerera sp. xch1]MBZ2174798.1 ASKHA domain-containing protein [Schnuerera sp. xch1]
MNEFKVVFNGKTEISVKEGTNLLEAERAAGLEPNAFCGGQGKCKKCKVKIIRGTQASEELACRVTITEDMEVETLRRAGAYKILMESASRNVEVKPGIPALPEQKEAMENCALAAFDIGTTTIAAYLLNAYDGEILAVGSKLNPQSQYAADVISRCNYELERGKGHLGKIVRGTMNGLLKHLTQKVSIKIEDIYGISVAANTAMHHLFLGLSPKSLVLAPYLPAMVKEHTFLAKDYDIHIHPEGILRVLPNIGSFVGADTSACLLALEFDKLEELTLMIDIGTNGEIVLGNKDRILACSTAAGPAFEGAKIECGMRGADGAIDHVSWENGQLKYTVINEKEPIGICGSGLIDAVAVMLQCGLLEPSGYLKHSPYYISDKVYLSQKDIRELQLAKSAIAAGIDILCKKSGADYKDIDKVLIAGAFGNYMSSESACDIGLIPLVLRKKITVVGNAAGEGAKLSILNKEEFNRAAKIAKKVKFMELALAAEFQDVFVEHMEFIKTEL